MRYAFRQVCRRCGAKLIMIPHIIHRNHYRVFVPGLRAAVYGCASALMPIALLLGGLVAIGGLIHALKATPGAGAPGPTRHHSRPHTSR